jgi:PPOX class probable F420-dependent enzyme
MLDLSSEKDAHVAQRLREDQIAWLGTVRPDGRPHLVPIWFLWEEGGTVLFFTEPDNQKVRNLRGNPRTTLAIDDTRGGGDVVLIEGESELLAEPAATVVPPAYVEKYRQGIRQLGVDEGAMFARYSQAVRVTPKRFVHW